MARLVDMFAPTRQAIAGTGQAFQARGEREIAEEERLANMGARQQQTDINALRLEGLQKQKAKTDAFDAHMSSLPPGADRIKEKLAYLKGTDADAFMEFSGRVMKQGSALMQTDPKAGIDFMNEKYGTNIEFVEMEGGLAKARNIDTGDIVYVDPKTGGHVKPPRKEVAKGQSTRGKLEADVKAGLITREQADATLGDSQYEGLSSGYETYLRAKKIQNTPENYDKYQKHKAKMADIGRKQKTKRPNIARLMAGGWVPSTRITEPMLDAYEAAAEKAEKDGKPFTADDLYKFEFQAQKNRATGRTAGGRLALSRKQNIESGRELLQEMKVTANKLDFSNIKMVGAFERFKKGQLSDPNFAEYMAQRADALFVITAAMKMNGVTDKAIEIEEEAFPVNSSPRVFNAWFNTQMRALNRAGKEMNKDFKYGIKEVPTFPSGQGGSASDENPVPTITEEPGQVDLSGAVDQKLGRTGTTIPELPQGAKQIGTSGGKPVFQTPDGKTFIQE